MYMADWDRLLARFSRRRGPAAFSALFDAAAPQLFAVAARLTPDATVAEDALQETFLFVLEHVDRYDPARPARPWLLGVLRRKVQEGCRRVRRAPDPLRVRPPVASPEPADAAGRREEAASIRRALLALPEPYRSVGLLRWRFGLEPAEIAELRGEPPSTVRATLSRALKRLRTTLGSIAVLVGLGGVARGLPAVRSTLLGHSALVKGSYMFKKSLAVALVLLGLLATWWAVSDSQEREFGRDERARSRTPASTTADSESANKKRPAVEGRTFAVLVSVRSLAGRALPGATVAAVRSAPPRLLRELYDPAAKRAAPRSAMTDRAGHARIDGLEPARWNLEATAPGYARESVVRTVHGDAEIVFHLGAGHVLRGTVREADGSPAAGVLVSSAAVRTVSDVRGEYRLEGLRWGTVQLKAARPGGAALTVARVSVPDVPRFDIVLDPVAVLAGRVTEADTNRPVAGVRVRAGIFFGHQGAGEATSDSDGRFAIRTLREGVVNQLNATLDGYMQVAPRGKSLRVPLRGHETTVRDIVLRRRPVPTEPPQITGRVLGPAGPLAGARVIAGGVGATADRDGRFELRGLKNGPFTLRAEFRGHYLKGPIPIELGASIDVRLDRGRSLSGRVESLRGKPLAGAVVGTMTTDKHGAFTLEGITPRAAPEFYVTCNGYVRTTLKVRFDSTAPLIVRMAPAPHVSGVITAEPGTPLRDTYVQVFVVTGRMRRGPGGGPEVIMTRPVPVREDGRYEAEVPWGGSGAFRVEVRSPGRPVTTSNDKRFESGRQEYDVNVILRTPLPLVAGRVVDAESLRPLPGAVVSRNRIVLAVADRSGRFAVRARDDSWLGLAAPGYVSHNVRSTGPFTLERALELEGNLNHENGRPAVGVSVQALGPVRGTAVTDDRGVFRIGGLARGEYTVSLRDPRLSHEPRTGVKPGAADVHIVVRTSAAIRGRVTDDKRRPLAGIVVRAGRARAVTGRDGAFELVPAATGEQTLVVNPPSQGPYQQGRDFLTVRQENVRPGVAPIVFVLKRALTASGHLFDEAGEPLAGVRLAAAGRLVATDAAGAFTLHGLAEGTHEVRIPPSRNTRGWRLLAPATVHAGARDLRLVATAGQTLRGRVADRKGVAIAGAAVIARTPDGRTRRAVTAANGTFTISGLHAARVDVTVLAKGFEKEAASNINAGHSSWRVVMNRKK